MFRILSVALVVSILQFAAMVDHLPEKRAAHVPAAKIQK